MKAMRIHVVIIIIALSPLVLRCAAGRAGTLKSGVPAEGESAEVFDILAAYYGGHAWGETEYAFARIITPASAASRGDAEVVFRAGEFGERVWTNHYFRSKPARTGDLKKGTVVFFTKFDPLTAGERLKSGWLMGVIESTDEIGGGFAVIALHSPGLEGITMKRKAVENIRIPLGKISPLTMPK